MREKEKEKQQLQLAKKARHAAGWRGLSVDLINYPTTSTDRSPDNTGKSDQGELEIDSVVGPDERLDGTIVRLIWSASHLDKGKLKLIWWVLPSNPRLLGLFYIYSISGY